MPGTITEQTFFFGQQFNHLYHERSLSSKDEMIYVGDSKYYRDDNEVIGESVGKQYTYAKNVIQMNMNHLITHNHRLTICGKELRSRDSVTEGYDFTPNFFIRSSIDFENDLDLKKPKLLHDQFASEFEGTMHFRNRLFYRDTLYIQTIDVNFMYVLQYYACGRKNKKVSKEFKAVIRRAIIDSLKAKYDFYLVTITDPIYSSLRSEERTSYVLAKFSECHGRMFCPEENKGVFILALEKGCSENSFILSSIDLKAGFAIREDADLTPFGGIVPKTISSTN